MLRPVREAAGLPQHIHVHDLRHSAASVLLAKGVELKVESEQLWLSTIRLTADTYIRTVEETKRHRAAKT
jgi:site-specific recombinase XerD